MITMGLIRLKIVEKGHDYIIIDDSLRLTRGASVKVKDYRGFEKASIEEDGTIKSKGKKVKT